MAEDNAKLERYPLSIGGQTYEVSCRRLARGPDAGSLIVQMWNVAGEFLLQLTIGPSASTEVVIPLRMLVEDAPTRSRYLTRQREEIRLNEGDYVAQLFDTAGARCTKLWDPSGDFLAQLNLSDHGASKDIDAAVEIAQGASELDDISARLLAKTMQGMTTVELERTARELEIEVRAGSDSEELREQILASASHTAGVGQSHSVVQLCAAMAISDQKVTPEEIEQIRRVASSELASLDEQSLTQLERSVELLRDSVVDVDALASELKGLLDLTEIESLMDMLFDIAIADGIFHLREEALLRQMHLALGSDAAKFERQMRMCRVAKTPAPPADPEPPRPTPPIAFGNWESYLHELSSSQCEALRRSGLETIEEIARAVEAGLLASRTGLTPMACRKIEDTVRSLVSADRALMLVADLDSLREMHGRFLDLPVEHLHPSSLIHNALEQLGVRRVADLFRLTTIYIQSQRGIGRKKVRQIVALRDRAIAELEARTVASQRPTQELAAVVKEQPQLPATAAEWTELVLSELSDIHSTTLSARIERGETLQEIAVRQDVTREAVRQRQIRGTQLLQIAALRHHIEQFLPLKDALESQGGFLWFPEVSDFLPAGVTVERADELMLPLLAAGVEEPSVWGEFITCLSGAQRDRALSRLRESLEALDATRIQLRDAVGAAGDAGLFLHDGSLGALLRYAWGIAVVDGVFTSPWTSLQQRYADALKRVGRPATLEEIMAQLAEMGAIELLDRSDASSRALLQNSDDVYSYGHGVYVHESNLPIAVSQLDEATDWALDRLRGRTGQVSAKTLLSELEQQRRPYPGLTPHLLKDQMVRSGGVLTFRASINVAWEASYSDDSASTLAEHLDQILRREEEPLTLEEVIDLLGAEVTYARTTIYQTLCSAAFIVVIEPGKFQHIETLGLTPDVRDVVLDEVHRILPDTGEPMTSSEVLGCLHHPRLAGVGRAAAVIWAIAGRDARFYTGTGHLMARAVGENRLVDRSVEEVLKRWGLIYPHELIREMKDNGFSGSEQTLRAALSRGVDRGDYERLPGGVYFAVAADDELFEAWLARPDVVFEVSRDQEFDQLEPEIAWPVVRFVTRHFLRTPMLIERFLKRPGLAAEFRIAAEKEHALLRDTEDSHAELTEESETFVAPPTQEPARNIDALFRLLNRTH